MDSSRVASHGLDDERKHGPCQGPDGPYRSVRVRPLTKSTQAAEPRGAAEHSAPRRRPNGQQPGSRALHRDRRRGLAPWQLLPSRKKPERRGLQAVGVTRRARILLVREVPQTLLCAYGALRTVQGGNLSTLGEQEGRYPPVVAMAVNSRTVLKQAGLSTIADPTGNGSATDNSGAGA